jgi:hypothetical protein
MYCRKNGDISGQRENKRNRETLAVKDFIAIAVGLAQILEGYAKCSLDVQKHQAAANFCARSAARARRDLRRMEGMEVARQRTQVCRDWKQCCQIAVFTAILLKYSGIFILKAAKFW